MSELERKCREFALTGDFRHLELIVGERPSLDDAIDELKGLAQEMGEPYSAMKALALSVGLDRADKNRAQGRALEEANAILERRLSAPLRIKCLIGAAEGLSPRKWWGI